MSVPNLLSRIDQNEVARVFDVIVEKRLAEIRDFLAGNFSKFLSFLTD